MSIIIDQCDQSAIFYAVLIADRNLEKYSINYRFVPFHNRAVERVAVMAESGRGDRLLGINSHLLPQLGDIPNADRSITRAGDEEYTVRTEPESVDG